MGRVVAVIPAKAVSKRLPGKNLRLFRGKPLVAHTIAAALASREIDEVHVSTDSPEIQALAQKLGADAPFLRPAELCGDAVHASVPILHAVEKLGGPAKYDFIVMLLPTAPLRTTETIDAVVRLSKRRATNVLSLTPMGKTLNHMRTLENDGTIKRVTKQAVYNFQVQDAPELYAINGCCYCAPAKDVFEHRGFQYGTPLGYVMDPVEALDIDTERDFLMLERLARAQAR